ncbi:MAG: HAD hydrolase-like protein, partial [Deltaproteobacteria bacterium]|nr:HAD hydrolase-like protein [Deltaproteobacteria bacterium]
CVKTEAIRDILAREGVSLSEAVMIGDSSEDAYAADECGVRFIGRDSGRGFSPDLEVYPDLLGVVSVLGLDTEASDG